ncbi:MAG TPA: hypothetical protein VFW33_00430 [Gemmataceae bacterium]|nr:hypothetical protein [Gemmataceae bacterium]
MPGGDRLLITRGDGLIDRDQAAELAGVTPDAVTIWATRGYWTRDRSQHLVLPVAKREGRKPLYDPVEVQKAEWHTRRRGRRDFPRSAAA